MQGGLLLSKEKEFFPFMKMLENFLVGDTTCQHAHSIFVVFWILSSASEQSLRLPGQRQTKKMKCSNVKLKVCNLELKVKDLGSRELTFGSTYVNKADMNKRYQKALKHKLIKTRIKNFGMICWQRDGRSEVQMNRRKNYIYPSTYIYFIC